MTKQVDGNPALSDSVLTETTGGPAFVHVELGLGKSALVLLWLSAVISAAAIVGLVVARDAYIQSAAHVNVLQYDLAQVKAQLVEQGLYEPTSH